MRFCRCHCRACGAHFTSLAAFDSHRQGFACVWPESGLTNVEGDCLISDPTAPLRRVTLHEHVDAERAREAFSTAGEGVSGTGSPQTARTERKPEVVA